MHEQHRQRILNTEVNQSTTTKCMAVEPATPSTTRHFSRKVVASAGVNSNRVLEIRYALATFRDKGDRAVTAQSEIFTTIVPRTNDSYSRYTQLPPKLSRTTRIYMNKSTPKNTLRNHHRFLQLPQAPPHKHTTWRAPHSPTTA